MVANECAFSFIVPLFNHVMHSKAMLNSLLRTLPASLDFEIILVDDGSVDGTKEWLHQLQNEYIRIVSNEVNLGYAKSNNRAAALAKGKILGLLNNDLIFLDGWLEPMIELINSPVVRAGIVGNIQHRVVDDAIDHVGIQVSHLAKIEHIHITPDTSVSFKRTFAVTGACCLILREDFLNVGGFDEQYVNGGEDVDLCLKLGMLGKYPYVSTRSRVKHHVSLTRDRTSLIHEQNSRLIFSKWKPVLLQAIKNAWLQLLTKNQESNSELLTDFNLQDDICRQTPHVVSLIAAKSVFLCEELRWKKMFDQDQSVFDDIRVEKFEGFYWDNDYPYPWVDGKAWFSLPKGTCIQNIFISGKLLETSIKGVGGLINNEVILEINGLQKKSWKNVAIGHFNLGMDCMVINPDYSTVVTVTIKLEGRSSIQLSSDAWKSFRVSYIVIDGQVALDFERKLRDE